MKFPFVTEPTGNYWVKKTKLFNKREQLKVAYLLKNDSLSKMHFIDSANALMVTNLLENIIPFWYGTEWDFNGYTAKPGEGVIACGYFVSTTLRDIGLNLNRYHMAQQAALNAAKSIQGDEALKFLRNVSNHQEVERFCQKHLSNGLYFVGLDSHVGFLYLKDRALYFIHSDYVSDKVTAELAATSAAFVSNMYVFCPISGNRSLTKKWLDNERIPIVRQ